MSSCSGGKRRVHVLKGLPSGAAFMSTVVKREILAGDSQGGHNGIYHRVVSVVDKFENLLPDTKGGTTGHWPNSHLIRTTSSIAVSGEFESPGAERRRAAANKEGWLLELTWTTCAYIRCFLLLGCCYNEASLQPLGAWATSVLSWPDYAPGAISVKLTERG
jgi:hypothetical protein